MTTYKDTKFSSFCINVQQKNITFFQPAILGILNITPDSFYDGGRYTHEAAIINRAHEIIDQGADIIDIGAVSSRPGATLLAPEMERDILVPAIKSIRAELPHAILSVDTCYSLPAEAAVNAGADMINDISGGQFDSQMFPTIARLQVPYILMHTQGTPDTMQQNTHYNDIIQDLILYFSQKLETLYKLGVKDIILDPGFGFAKTTAQNYELLNRLSELSQIFPQPILAALSRKSMIYKPLNITPQEALNGTTALNTVALLNGARLLRVHDIPEARQTIKIIENLKQ